MSGGQTQIVANAIRSMFNPTSSGARLMVTVALEGIARSTMASRYELVSAPEECIFTLLAGSPLTETLMVPTDNDA